MLYSLQHGIYHNETASPADSSTERNEHGRENVDCFIHCAYFYITQDLNFCNADLNTTCFWIWTSAFMKEVGALK